MLKAEKIVTVNHFGTFSPYLYHEREAHNVVTGRMEKFPALKSIRFHPAWAVERLLRDRRVKFDESARDSVAWAKKVTADEKSD